MSKFFNDAGRFRLVTNGVTVLEASIESDASWDAARKRLLVAIERDDTETIRDFRACVDGTLNQARTTAELAEHFASPEDVHHPLILASQKVEDIAFADSYAFYTSSKFNVKTYDAAGGIISDPTAQIRSGSIVRLVVDFKAYISKDGNPEIGVYMKGIQKLRDGAPVAWIYPDQIWKLFASN